MTRIRYAILGACLASVNAPAITAQPCPAVEGLTQALPPAGGALILGEVHGSAEGPAFVKIVVCHFLAADREKILVALEWPIEEQESIDRFLEPDGGAETRQQMLQTRMWSQPHQDGRTSVAMFALLEHLRERRQSGDQISVAGFDSYAQGADRDRAMGERLRELLAANPDSAIVVLTGNLHNRLLVGNSWDPDFKPMVLYLEPGSYRSLRLLQPTGNAWVCQGSQPEDCGEANLGQDAEGLGDTLSVELFDEEQEPAAYHGQVRLLSRTASPPAVTSEPEPTGPVNR